MPNLEEHCKHSLKRYEAEGRDIHTWLDEPSRHYAGSHREFRHDEETIILAGETFGKTYGKSKAEAIALDHITADHEEAIKKREKNGAALSEKKTYEIEKPKYKKKKEELKKMLRRESELPEIKTGGMRDFLDRKYAHKEEGLKKLAETSLRHWQQYVLSRENPNLNIEIKDITRYVSNLSKKESPRTISIYLGFLVKFLKHESEKELADYTNTEQRKFAMVARNAEKNTKPMPVKDVVELYKNGRLEDKIMIRLLLLETDIPIECLGRLSFNETSEGEYVFSCDDKIIKINPETVNVAEPLIKKNKSKSDRRLLCISKRQIEYNIHNVAERINLSYNVTPKDLRKFGKIHAKDELIEWLRE